MDNPLRLLASIEDEALTLTAQQAEALRSAVAALLPSAYAHHRVSVAHVHFITLDPACGELTPFGRTDRSNASLLGCTTVLEDGEAMGTLLPMSLHQFGAATASGAAQAFLELSSD